MSAETLMKSTSVNSTIIDEKINLKVPFRTITYEIEEATWSYVTTIQETKYINIYKWYKNDSFKSYLEKLTPYSEEKHQVTSLNLFTLMKLKMSSHVTYTPKKLQVSI